jgi:hypothetical protein
VNLRLFRLVVPKASAGFWGNLEKAAMVAVLKSKGENFMAHSLEIPLPEFLDDFAWDLDEVRDLIQTTPLRFDEVGIPVGYDAEQLFGLEAADLLRKVVV